MSNRPGPPIGRHCPLKSGYFESSHAPESTIVTHSAAKSTQTPSEIRQSMTVFLLSDYDHVELVEVSMLPGGGVGLTERISIAWNHVAAPWVWSTASSNRTRGDEHKEPRARILRIPWPRSCGRAVLAMC